MRRRRILILLGLVLALGTAAAVFFLLQSTDSGDGAEIEREEVVVAVQPIPEDEPVEGRIELRAVPVETIPEGAIRAVEETAGLLAAGPIPQGTILQPDLLISPEERMQEGELGKLVEPGFLAVAMPIDELSSVSYGIQPGDHVDVLMSFFFIDVDPDLQIDEPVCPPICPGPAADNIVGILSDQRPRFATQLTLQDVRVLGVGRWGHEEVTAEEQEAQQGQETIAPELPKYVTLMVTPQDALVLKMAREQGASIDLAVRAQDDLQQFATQQVTLDYIMARFGISLPAKQPYTVEDVEAVQPRPELETTQQ